MKFIIKMNKKTLVALRGSIKKWEGIVKGIVIDEVLMKDG